MKTFKLFLILTHICIVFSIFGQQNVITPDLTEILNSDTWVLHNREVSIDTEVHLNGTIGDGLLWLKEPLFSNGKIELDIKGKDEQGKSFVGLAFHGVNDSTFEAIYFRPFNFKNPERDGHSVQYISHPEYPWHRLREEHPEKYENTLSPVPDPNNWFHVTIIIESPNINVYVNNSEKPSLTVEQIGEINEFWIGFYVGYYSEGYFKNLKIFTEK